MLELNTYGTIPIEDVKDVMTAIYVIIDDIYKAETPKEIQNRRHIDKSVLSDSEIITISIMGEIMSNDSEKAWLTYVSKNMRDMFPRICELSRFNRTRRNLIKVLENIRVHLNPYYDYFMDDLRIVDSLPLQVCEFGRACFDKLFKGLGATYGKCPSKKLTYYGYKIHAICTANGFITDFVITSASVDDREAVYELVETCNSHLEMLGDKGYISTRLAADLFDEKGTLLVYLKRNNSKDQYPRGFRRAVFKMRRRVETSFSQLADQFKMETTRAKSLWGLQARLQTKILAFNICFIINQILGRSYYDMPKIKGLVF